MGQHTQPHAKAWTAKTASFDAFGFVTPDYNHGPSGALKNAIDYLYREWNNKTAGIVGHGSAGGARAEEQLRLVMGDLLVADVGAQAAPSLFTDFENFGTFNPAPIREKSVNVMLDQVIAWGVALTALRKQGRCARRYIPRSTSRSCFGHAHVRHSRPVAVTRYVSSIRTPRPSSSM